MNKTLTNKLDLTIDQFLAYNKSGPRYTSYPTAVEFDDGFGPSQYQEILRRADQDADIPLSVYTHLPFCVHKCLFCACNMIVAKDRSITTPYLKHLKMDYELHAAHLKNRRKVSQYHWGGGTPTYLNCSEIKEVFGWAKDIFDFEDDAEISVEVHPKITTEEQIQTLATLGFNRISLGVQDLSGEVQAAIERYQTPEQTWNTLNQARKYGFKGINMDLIYGLPKQNMKTFEHTINIVLEMKPERVALYSFGYVPWLEGAQRKIFEDALPQTKEKFELFLMAYEKFSDAGYLQVGIDHFALPNDELIKAQEKGKLMRNFMGYTTKRAQDMIGLGVSSIGNIGGVFAQNTKKLPRYYQALEEGSFAVEKGLVRTQEDDIRAAIVSDLMCNFQIDMHAIEKQFGIDFASHFKDEIQDLDGYEKDGMIVFEQPGVTITPLGKFFVRNLAMVFDAYLKDQLKKNPKGVFSKTI